VASYTDPHKRRAAEPKAYLKTPSVAPAYSIKQYKNMALSMPVKCKKAKEGEVR